MTARDAALRSLDDLRRVRQSLDAAVDDLPPEAWHAVPDGFQNNVLWNVGHVVVTAELLTYGRAGLDLPSSPALVAACRKGTSPDAWAAPPDTAEVRRRLAASPDQIEADYRAGRFQTYDPYTTTPGVVLGSVEDALRFVLFHEGLHLGTVRALRRLVT